MKTLSQLNIRVIFILLLCFCIVPLSVMQFIHIHRDRAESIEVLSQDVEQTGQLISSQVATLVEEAKMTMTVLSHVEELTSHDTTASRALLASLGPHFPSYANMGVAFANGIIFASIKPITNTVDLTPRPWYQQLQKKREFVIGEYQIGKITHNPGLNFAIPLHDSTKKGPIATLFIALDLKAFDDILSHANIPESATIVITDTNGTILSRYPDAEHWRGKIQPHIKGVSQDGPLAKSRGIDGKERLYKLIQVPNSSNRLKVLIGYSQTQIEKTSNEEMLRNLIVLLIVIGFTLAIAGGIAQQKLILPLLDLKAGADKIGKGDYSVRIHQNPGIHEIAALGESFNSMASSLQLNLELTQVWMDTMPGIVFRKSREGVYLACNQAMSEFLGKPKSEIIGHTTSELNGPLFAQLLQNKDNELIAHPGLQSFEAEIKNSQGQTRTALFTRSTYYNAAGHVEGFVGVMFDITERKEQEKQILLLNQNLEILVAQRTGSLEQANHELVEARNMLELVLNTIPIRVFWKDTQSVFLGCNQIFAEDAGLATPAEIVGKHEEELPWGAYAAEYRADDRRVMDAGMPIIGYEEALVIPGKAPMVVRTSKIPLRDSNGTRIGIMGVFDDITQHKEMEESIRTSERFMHTITDNIPGLLSYWTKDLHCAFSNSAYQEWFGKSPHEMQGITMQELMGPDLFAKNEMYIRAALVGKPETFERTLTKSDGSIGYTWAQYLPDFENGQVRGFFVLVTDITEVKKAQFELMELTTRLSLATQAGEVGVWEYDLVHNQLLWDEQMFALYGVRKEDFSGAYEAWLEGVHPEDRERGNAEIQQAISGEKTFNTEFRVCWPNGSTHNIRAMAIVQRDEFGTAQRVIGTNWDITKQKESEENIRQTNEFLEEATIRANDMAAQAEMASAAKSEFLANMSHEIRTPMNAILGFSDILANIITDPRQKDYLQSIRASGKTLLTLINDILDLSKIEAGRMEIQYAPVDIHSLMHEIEAIFKQKSSEKNLNLNVIVAPNTPNTMLLDGTRLRQILFNLVGNAVKFTTHGGITLEVNAHNVDGLALDISVCDSGIGIPPDQLELIFQPFRQQKGQIHALYGGTGLGLTISQRLAAMMNGTIQVESEYGKGSTFTLHLAQVGEASDAASIALATGTIPASTFHFSNCKVLVADDVIHNRELLKAMLELPGISVRTVKTGQDALEAAQEEAFDIILMDIRMPEMDGLEAVQMLKDNQKLRDIPVVAVTASVLGDAEQKSKEAGFDGYLRKPIQRTDLLHLMVSLLGTKASETKAPLLSESPTPETLERKCKDIPALLNTINSEILPACERLRSKMFISQIRELGSTVETLALQYQDQVLLTWVTTLRKALDDFDTTRIGLTLAGLSELLPTKDIDSNAQGAS